MANDLPTLEELTAYREQQVKELESYPIKNYMSVTSTSMSNQNPDGTSNPHECAYFYYTCQSNNDADGTGDIKKWYLHGDYPYNLSIDNGLVSGTIWMLNDQPFIKELVPAELTKYSGTNWEKSGRPPGTTYTFNFYVSFVYEYTLNTSDGGSTGPSTGLDSKIVARTQPAPMTIRTVRSWTVDNLIFTRLYLSKRKTRVWFSEPIPELDMKNYVDNPHHFLLDGKYYTIDDFDQLIKAHPGPFPSNCDYGVDLDSLLPPLEDTDSFPE